MSLRLKFCRWPQKVMMNLLASVCACVELLVYADLVGEIKNQAFHHAYWTWIHVWNPVSQAKRGSICYCAWWLNWCCTDHLKLHHSHPQWDVYVLIYHTPALSFGWCLSVICTVSVFVCVKCLYLYLYLCVSFCINICWEIIMQFIYYCFYLQTWPPLFCSDQTWTETSVCLCLGWHKGGGWSAVQYRVDLLRTVSFDSVVHYLVTLCPSQLLTETKGTSFLVCGLRVCLSKWRMNCCILWWLREVLKPIWN